MEPVGDIGNGEDILSDIIARHSISPCRGADEAAVFIE